MHNFLKFFDILIRYKSDLKKNLKKIIFLLHVSKKAVSLHSHSRYEIMIVEWCNGSTADFGSACQGSNPCSTTNL